MKRQLPLSIFVISLIVFAGIASYEYDYLTSQKQNGISITGNIKIMQNGKVIRNIPDAIQGLGGVDTIMCYLFNYSSSCTSDTAYFGSATNQLGTACQYWKGTSSPVLTNGFYSNAICNITGIALSTDTSAVSTSTICPSIQTANGMSPAQGSLVLIPSPAGIQLTASFTPTSTVTLSKLCLIAWNSHSSTFSVSNTGTLNGNAGANAFAIDAISPTYTTTPSTPFTIQWTITIGYS